MSLSIFIAVVKEGNDIVANNILKYPDWHKYKDTTYFIRTTKDIKEIDKDLGFNVSENENKVTGVIFRLNSAFSGYTEQSLWDWIYAKPKESYYSPFYIA